MFIVTASPAPAQALTVFYNTGGSAALGSDYTLEGNLGQVVIPAGQGSAGIHMHALQNSGRTKGKTVKLKLNANTGYKMPKRNGKAATIKIVGQ
jgi:hypothetical protein